VKLTTAPLTPAGPDGSTIRDSAARARDYAAAFQRPAAQV
jgi:hypothetical protein